MFRDLIYYEAEEYLSDFLRLVSHAAMLIWYKDLCAFAGHVFYAASENDPYVCPVNSTLFLLVLLLL